MPGEKRWWILIGGMRRLGAALAEDLAADYNLVLTGSTDANRRWLKELEGITGIRTFRWDALDPDLGPKMMADLARLESAGIHLHGAVIVAGSFPEQPFGQWTPEGLEETWRLNLTFPLLCAQALAPHLEEASCLQILLDSSVHRPFVKRLPHGVSKAGLASLVPGLARILAPRIRVVGHALGTVLPHPGSDPDRLAAQSLLKRNGEPADVARALRFAAQSPYLNGVVLTQDGGR